VVASFRINENLEAFQNDWGANNGAPFIDNAELNGFMLAWIMKIVPCSDLPLSDYDATGGVVTAEVIDENIEIWKSIDSFWTPPDNFTGCGYKGKTQDNSSKVMPVKYNDGCEGC
jgi:hypothetical protein